MKKIYLLLLFIGIMIPAISQQPVKFFHPIPDNLFETSGDRARANQSVWLVRPTVQITAIQMSWDKERKGFDVSSLQSAGPGISYAHYISVDGQPYNNFSLNGLLLFGLDPGATTQASLSGALTISVFELLNAGVGYNFALHKPFILTGVTLRF